MLFAFTALVLVPLSAQAERRVALVIGNSKYLHTSPLPNPHNDAAAIAAALKRLDFEVVLALDVAFADTHKPIREFSRRLQGADVALLFYAGHALSLEGRNYLVPVDAEARDETDVKFRMTLVNSVVDEMARLTRLTIVILDACRDNPLARSLHRTVAPSRSADVGMGLATMSTVGRELLIMFATAPGAVASDGVGEHSPFSQALLRHIEKQGIDVEALVRSIRQDVREITGGNQLPEAWLRLEQRFQFRKDAADGKAALLPPAKDAIAATDARERRIQDRTFWESIRELNSLKLFQDYVARFPEGEYASIAHVMIGKLEGKSKLAEPPSDPTRAANEAYTAAVAEGTDAALGQFVQRFPDHVRAAELKRALEERTSWRAAQTADTRPDYERYLLTYPQGIYAPVARERIATLARNEFAALPQPKEPAPPANDRSAAVAALPPPIAAPQPEVVSPSFNCQRVTAPAELTICGNAKLARLDIELAQLFAVARGRMNAANAIKLRDSQRAWLRLRDGCLADANCLEQQYVQRIQQLRASGG